MVRGRVVVVVGGVMSIQGDGKTAHKAKDHSRDAPRIENGFRLMLIVKLDPGESSRAMESRMR